MSHLHEHEETSACCGHEEHGCCGHAHERHHEHEHAHHHEHHDHDHGHSHEHGSEAERGVLIRVIVSAALLAASFLLPEAGLWRPLLLLAAYLIAGYPVLREAAENLIHGAVFDECFLMAVASLGAICIGEWQEAVMVMTLYQLGEYLQDRALSASRRSIRELMNVRPDTARVLRSGQAEERPAQEVAVGECIQVRPGERIPLDSVVVEGVSELNNAALTGESLPVPVAAGAQALAGCVNLSGVLTLRVEKPFGDSAASRILRLVEEASDKKARSEQFITRFARVYTPAVVLIAAALAVIPPLLGLGAWRDFIYRALDFLVISCPCALVISVPLSYFAGLGCASRSGILIKGGSFMDVLAEAECAAFDKTGTLTEGRFSVQQLIPAVPGGEAALLELAALAESASDHPLAQSVLNAYGKEPQREALREQRETAGHGVSCVYQGKTLLAGKAAYLAAEGIALPPLPRSEGTQIHVAYGGVYQGALVLADAVKSDTAEALAELKTLGLKRIVLLSGDRREAVDAMQRHLGIDEAYGELLPEDKVHHMETLQGAENRKGSLLYTGDGINDAPVLALADVGIAMGGLGTDAAMEAADVVIMGESLRKLPLAIRIARKTARIAKENIAFALAVKVAVMLLAAFGHVELGVAVFADVGVCLLAILNSLRAARI